MAKTHAAARPALQPSGWTDVVLICRKCSKKAPAAYGEKGDQSLRQALRDALRARGQRGQIGLVETRCFGLCPKKAVTVLRASDPGVLLAAAPGMPADAILPAAPNAKSQP